MPVAIPTLGTDPKDAEHVLDDPVWDAGLYRSAVGTLIHVGHDRPDAQHGIRILCTEMSKPNKKPASAGKRKAT